MMIFKWEWVNIQEGHQVGMGENQNDFSHFLTIFFLHQPLLQSFSVGSGEIWALHHGILRWNP